FPDRYRARINSGFTLALPIAVATGAPISTALLGLAGLWGLKGWQVMYVLEAIPTVLIGVAVFFYLTDKVDDARWLAPEERRWLLFCACLLSAVGLALAGLTSGTWWPVVGMSIGAAGFYGTKGPCWSIPTMFLTGTAAASHIAWINSLGNLGGFFGPSMVGWAKNLTGNFAGGLYALAVCALVSAVISLFWLRIPRAVAPGGEEYPLPAE